MLCAAPQCELRCLAVARVGMRDAASAASSGHDVGDGGAARGARAHGRAGGASRAVQACRGGQRDGPAGLLLVLPGADSWGWGSRRRRDASQGVCGPLHRGNMPRHATCIVGSLGMAAAGRIRRGTRGRLDRISRRALRIKMRSAAVPCGFRELTRAPNGEGFSFRAPYVNRESYYGI
jgi:hypothetical protein